MTTGSGATHAPVAVIGGGPAGLMAAQVVASAGVAVDLYDAMPSVGRKFLLAGKGGLNLTHSEPLERFVQRYGDRQDAVAGWLSNFGPGELRAWAASLGIGSFVGSSGRVFPTDMKAAPLLRAWLQRLRAAGVRLHMRHRWLGWTGAPGAAALSFLGPDGPQAVMARAAVLALGGASWPRLGSDGAWVPWLAERGVAIAPLQPANCGFDVGWSEHFAGRFAGTPVKSVLLDFRDRRGRHFRRQGEFVITQEGIEGSLVYAASALLRDEISACGTARAELDLVPGRDLSRLAQDLARPRAARSLANHLREHAGIEGVKAGLLRETMSTAQLTQALSDDPLRFAARLKAWPLVLRAPRPIEEAISTAGGVRLEALDEQLMLRALPGVFCAGEMLDWEAPTGGYLISACLASGYRAGQGVLDWLGRTNA